MHGTWTGDAADGSEVMNKYYRFVILALVLLAFGGASFASPSRSRAAFRPNATIAVSSWSNIGPNDVTAASVQSNGPGVITGRVNSVAVNPVNPSIIYAGASEGEQSSPERVRHAAILSAFVPRARAERADAPGRRPS